jgi:hypothetical protein
MTRAVATAAAVAAPVLIICCVDYRYLQVIQQFVTRRFRVARYGMKTDAGGTRTLLRGPQAVRAWIWRNVTLAYERQGVRRVFLFHHQDCLLYGGSAAFAGPSLEMAVHRRDLRRAAALLTRRFRDLQVRAFYAHQAPRGIRFTAA